VECKNSVDGRFTEDNCERNVKTKVRFSENTRGQMRQGWRVAPKSRRIYIFSGKWNGNHQLITVSLYT
jgi:hypothetical protein